MSTNSRSRSLVIGIATVVALALLAPVAVTAEEEPVALAPVAAPVVTSTSGDDVWGTRALAAQHALQSGDIGSMQEDRLLAIVAAAPSWDETSGYGAVETNRASIVEDVVSIALVYPMSADVRWAPEPGPAWLAASRAAAARRAAPTFPAWDAARWSPVEPSQAASPDDISAALASGQRAESAHLATVPLPGEDAPD
jgi:hypothetical protein